jgi:hypothetical protein
MFNDLSEVRQANKEIGHHWFEPATMKFFASRIESSLYKNQCFITSEKRCFDDYTRVYSVRRVKPDGSIETLERQLESKSEALEYIKDIS